MACPLCGEDCSCSYTPRTTRVSAPRTLTYEYDNDRGTGVAPVIENAENTGEAVAPVRASAIDESRPIAPPEDIALEPAPQPSVDTMWKQEIASRLESYRARRGTRRPRYNGTLSLDFERAANRMMALAEDPEPENEFFGASSAALADEAAPSVIEDPSEIECESQASAYVPAPRVHSPEPKIIEFPRLPTLFDTTPAANELADPVLDKPRILLVPEEVPTAVAPHADIQLEPAETAVDELELPPCVAPIGHRLLAGCADALIVLVAASLFMAIVLQQVPPPDGRVGYALVAMLPAALWAIYEYLFLVHRGVTPGMKMAGLSLASLDSEIVRRSTRRARALACMLSAFPLALGLVWALLDDDTLCWHDRITRTYLVRDGSNE